MNATTLEDIKNSAKNLIENNGASVNTKVPSLEETVEGILNASTPARKAHATRKLTSYAVNHAKNTDSTPTRVIAGVCAVVTKRITKRSNKDYDPQFSKYVRGLKPGWFNKKTNENDNPISISDLSALKKKLDLLMLAAPQMVKELNNVTP